MERSFQMYNLSDDSATLERLDNIRNFHERKAYEQQVEAEAQRRYRNTSSTLFNFQRIVKQSISDFSENNVIIQWVKEDGTFFFGGLSQPPNNEPSYTYVGSIKNFVQNETLFDLKAKREIITQYVSSSHAKLSHVVNIPIDICSFKHVFKNPRLNAFRILERICYNNIFSVNSSNDLSDLEKIVLLFIFGVSSLTVNRIIEQSNIRSRRSLRGTTNARATAATTSTGTTCPRKTHKKRRTRRNRSFSCSDVNSVCVDLNFGSRERDLAFRRIELTEDLLLNILTTHTFRYNEDELLTMTSILSDKLLSHKRDLQTVLDTSSHSYLFLGHVLKRNFLNDYSDPRQAHALLSCNENVYEHVCHGMFVGHHKIPLRKSVDFVISNSREFALKTKIFFCRRILFHPDIVKLSVPELRKLKLELQRACKYTIQFDYHLCANPWLEPKKFHELTQSVMASTFPLDFLLFLYLKQRKFITFSNLRDLCDDFGVQKICYFISSRCYAICKKIVLFYDDVTHFVITFDLSQNRQFLRTLILEGLYIDDITRILLLDYYKKFFGRRSDYDLSWLESLVRRILGLTVDPTRSLDLVSEILNRYLLPSHFVRGF